VDLKLKGKNAIVCASSRGIGYAVAKGLLKEGANVIINSRNKEECELAVKSLANLSEAQVFGIPGDLSNSLSPEIILEESTKKIGSIDILFNNCGGPPMKSLLETENTDWEDAYNSILMSSVRLTKLVIPGMISRKWGRIITLGSSIMKEPTPQMVLSATFRAAVVSFMKAISIETAQHGITVNTISTGGVITERLKKLVLESSKRQGISYEEALSSSSQSIPLKRLATPEEFAQAIIFLSSELSSYITGECLSIDGGLIKADF